MKWLVGCIAVLCGLSWGATCTKEKSCECVEKNFTIDLAQLGCQLEDKNITIAPDGDQKFAKFTFLLSLCQPIVCNFTKGASGVKEAAACQYNPDQYHFTMLGQQSTFDWNVDPSDEADFYIMYTQGDPIDADGSSRQTKVQFTIDNSVEKPVVVFDYEQIDTDKKTHTFVFKVTLPHSEDDRSLCEGNDCPLAFLITASTISLLTFLVVATGSIIILAMVVLKVRGGKMFVKVPMSRLQTSPSYKKLPDTCI